MRFAKTLLLLLLITLLSSACQLGPVPFQTAPSALGPSIAESNWWDDVVFYEVFVRSFYDSDSDGIGDLPGLIEKLDYLNDGDPTTTDDLGVTGIWLMPVTQSPSYHGYDAVDYYTVEEDYGTNEDFQHLVEQAHARGIRIIVDLMLNHTSSQHPWFRDAQRGADSDRRDWYIWRADSPGWRAPWGAPVWHSSGEDYYFGLFWEGMPDLNYRNEEVSEEMHRVARFWLEEMGVDGFRLDAIRHLIEVEDQLESTPETHQWLVTWDDFIDQVDPQALTVGEIWEETAQVVPYVTNDEVDVAFEFMLADSILRSINAQNPFFFADALGKVLASYPPGQFAPFLTNHDQNRVMTQLNGDQNKAKLAAGILLTLPGVPFIYYGEEIGMTGAKPDELIRTPMQWSAERGAGFTSGQPWQSVNQGYESINVATQAAQPDSLLNHYRRLIHLRNDYVALRQGSLEPVESSCRPVYSYLRHYTGSSSTASDAQTLLVLLNFSADTQRDCRFSLAQSGLTPGTAQLVDLLSGEPIGDITIEGSGGFSDAVLTPQIEPRAVHILLLER